MRTDRFERNILFPVQKLSGEGVPRLDVQGQQKILCRQNQLDNVLPVKD